MQKVYSGCIKIQFEPENLRKKIIAKFKKKLVLLDVVENSENQLGKPDSRIICITYP